MKRIFTLLGVCALLGAAQQAEGTAYSLQANGNWNNAATWSTLDGGTYPSSGSDTATFSVTSGRTVTVNGSFSYGATTATHPATVAFDNASDPTLTTTSLTVNADSRDVTLTQTGDASDVFQINGDLTVQGDQPSGTFDAILAINGGKINVQAASDTLIVASDTSGADATIQINNAGTEFDPSELFFFGGTPGTGGKAKYDIVNGSPTAPDLVTMHGDCLFQSKLSVTMSGNLVVEPEPNPSGFLTEAVINVIDNGDAMTVGQVLIGGANYTTQLEFQGAGSLTSQ